LVVITPRTMGHVAGFVVFAYIVREWANASSLH
jgi:hypothetical protein